MEQLQAQLMAYGLDSFIAKKISKKYTLSQLKNLDLKCLISLDIPKEIAQQLLGSSRIPIPQKTVEEILLKSAFTCCVCHQSGLPVVIHHLKKWEHSRSHDIDNLAVLCLNHHGEAHSHHENSRNLTADIIKKARNEWYEIIEKRSLEKEEALGNLQSYTGRWDYFNISYIYSLITDYNINYSSRYMSTLMTKGLINEDATINSDKLTAGSSYWLNFFDGGYVKLHIEEMVNSIIRTLPIQYINNSSYSLGEVSPGDLCLIDGSFYFRRMNKLTKGIGQTRRAECTINQMKFTGEFDAWYCNSSSSYCNHLTGKKSATQLCLVRNVENIDDFNLIHCTIIGLGLNLTKPDMMTQLMGGLRNISATPSLKAYENELDRIADLQRGKKEKQYYSPSPEICDICQTRLENKKYMIDGEVKNRGSWACMCPECFHIYGTRIGWGTGQLYWHENNQWLMVGGFCENEHDID